MTTIPAPPEKPPTRRSRSVWSVIGAAVAVRAGRTGRATETRRPATARRRITLTYPSTRSGGFSSPPPTAHKFARPRQRVAPQAAHFAVSGGSLVLVADQVESAVGRQE